MVKVLKLAALATLQGFFINSMESNKYSLNKYSRGYFNDLFCK